MLKKLFFFIILSLLYSCQTEQKKIKEHNLIVDATILAFEKKLLTLQIDSLLEKNHFNGSVAVFKNNELLYERTKGFSDFKKHLKIDSSTVFAIGSISKQFTAVLLLLQVEQGKLSLTDKASQYLSEFNTLGYENILIHQLLNHTSGLDLMGQKLRFKSGTNFFYSNDGFNAAGQIIEKVSGKSFVQNLNDLFTKVGLHHTSAGYKSSPVNFAGAYVGNSKIQEAVKNMPYRLSQREIGLAAGGILSTINDLHLWNQQLYTGKIIQPQTLSKFIAHSSEREHAIFGKTGYGYGIMSNIFPPKAYFHSGYVKGSPSLNIYYPETQTSVIILSNIADENLGIKHIFHTHREIKHNIDQLQNVVTELQKMKLKTSKNKN
ncbi:serine hydrolase [Elizabethkingia argentiflava]|uniref:Serine hydrolase n=1 Tax=Elizabethkingia argenteiflava TaxID=2681556 RepID=A0A845PYS9_9FLAO|nr:serine hydrolase domain-containing protein [Elizabethkingia argenteiflava]NAW51240.1 serine hydrolase [Elizabethkingia argenteiflava]